MESKEAKRDQNSVLGGGKAEVMVRKPQTGLGDTGCGNPKTSASSPTSSFLTQLKLHNSSRPENRLIFCVYLYKFLKE